MELLLHTATLHRAGSSRTPAIQCCTAWGHWAWELLPHTAAAPWGTGQRIYCYTSPHFLGAIGGETRVARRHIAGGSGQWKSYRTLLHHVAVVGGATMDLRIAWERWARSMNVGGHGSSGGRFKGKRETGGLAVPLLSACKHRLTREALVHPAVVVVARGRGVVLLRPRWLLRRIGLRGRPWFFYL